MKKFFYRDTSKSFGNDNSGSTSYSCSNGKVVFIEDWVETSLGTNPQDGLKYYLEYSQIEIKNCSKYNGIYITNYKVNENFINETQKELVVNYLNTLTGKSIKITYKNNWQQVKFELN